MQLSATLHLHSSRAGAHRPLLLPLQHEAAQGQVVNLLRVAAEPTVDLAVRQAASISFKNAVKSKWEPPEGGWTAAGGRAGVGEQQQHSSSSNSNRAAAPAPAAVTAAAVAALQHERLRRAGIGGNQAVQGRRTAGGKRVLAAETQAAGSSNPGEHNPQQAGLLGGVEGWASRSEVQKGRP